ncbi:hypothetical protein K8T06_07375 [bacterium]|nr:hypothetical protein [bacterium]
MEISGSRQFREKVAKYLNSDETVLVTRHGKITGIYLPLNHKTVIPDSFQKTLAETLAHTLGELVSKLHMSEHELETTFKSLRYQLTPGLLHSEIRSLIDEQRDRCLWFLANDYYPKDSDSVIYILDTIRKHGNLDAFRKAEELKRWHLHLFSKKSVDFYQKTGS